MNQMSSVKKSCICAICIALCYVLPMAFHAFGIGDELSPMHIPVFLCGLLLGPGYGGFCGIAGPIISSTTGMPSFLQLFYMVPELVTYGLVCGLMMKLVHTKKLSLDLYLAMVPAMILGRIVGGIARMLVIRFMGTGEVFTISVWALGYFVGTLPGIVAQLVLMPILIIMLEKARVIPKRYNTAKQV